ncbi:hypothetical protein K9M48_02430 [Candidatus Gracilibacteria bacterium]|nr:hypothetical protein [Candidatus Gracilibacteria bacterium]
MDKEFSYGGFRFNIKVELDHKIERRPNGKRWHKVTVNDMGPSNYYKVAEFEELHLLEGIKTMQQSAKNWVDQRTGNTPQSAIEQQLTAIGFK